MFKIKLIINLKATLPSFKSLEKPTTTTKRLDFSFLFHFEIIIQKKKKNFTIDY